MNNYMNEYEKWIKSSYVAEQDKQVLRGMSEEEIHEAFYKTAEFGTGGMRGIMGLGMNRINIYTIRMAAKALADMMPERAKVVVAYDTRHGSRDFAEETAKVLAAAGVKVYLFDRVSPVPLLSFAVRRLGANGGVVITASHNTKEYNGFKVYDETGCQCLPDKTEIIASNMKKMEDPLSVETVKLDDAIIDTGMIVPVGQNIINEFLEAIADFGEYRYADNNLKIVYTSLHGSGRDYVLQALNNAGFSEAKLVQAQAEFDGDFPTVNRPNPEDPEALEMASKIATGDVTVDSSVSSGMGLWHDGSAVADIIIGTDPDCDRVGVGAVCRNAETGRPEVKYLTGNQTGVLLIDYLCRIAGPAGSGSDGAPRRLITTIVTSEMGPIIARSHGAEISYVLTGFKYIGGIMNEMAKAGRLGEFLMGYEESYGYLTGTHARDKDGISSALTICRMAAYHKANGRTLLDALDILYDKYGYWLDSQESLVYEGSEGEETMKKIMAAFREKKEKLFGIGVRYEDFEEDGTGPAKADVLKYIFEDGSWVAVRPSGTEPKIKIYYCMNGATEAEAGTRRQAASDCIRQLTSEYN